MKFLVLGNEKSWETQRILTTLKQMRHIGYSCQLSDLFFDFSNMIIGIFDVKNKTHLNFYDAIIVRHPGKYYAQLQAVVDYCNAHGIPVMNGKAILNMPQQSKFYLNLAMTKNGGLPFLPTFSCGSIKEADMVGVHGFPCSMQNFDGKSIFVQNKKEACRILEKIKRTDNVMIQKAEPLAELYQILIVDGVIIGAILNSENVGQPSPKITSIAQKVCSALLCDTAMIFVIKKDDEVYIKDVNMFYDFVNFENITNVDVAFQLIRMMEYQII